MYCLLQMIFYGIIDNDYHYHYNNIFFFLYFDYVYNFITIFISLLKGDKELQNKKDVVEMFYIATHLPILSLSFDGTILAAAGYNNRFYSLLEEYNIYEKVKESLLKEKNLTSIPLPSMKNTYFSACLINPKNINMGFFVMGPHSCNDKNSMGIPYKPKCLMPSLKSLLYNLNRDFCCVKISNSYSYHVKKALDYINSKYSEDITLLDVSNYLNINKSYLCSLLKKELGKTFTGLLNEIRVEKSKRLLSETDHSILDIALQVGFNNQNYFNIVFKKITNMTPLQFRNKS